MTHDTPSAGEPAALRRVAAAALLGTAVEFYDFFIYGTAAALVFGRVFFPGLGPVGALLAAFSVYAVAFAARPLGAVLFGHFGDRLGRRATLVVSLLLMGLSTAAVGLLPDYGRWGGWAPVLLTVLRFCQGLGLGGEWGGAALLLAEHAPAGRRGRYGGLLQLGPCAGFFLATGVFLVLGAVLDEAAFLAWGWRVPFLASLVLVAIGLFVRLRVAESPVFRAERVRPRVPAAEVLARHGRPVLLGGGAVMSGYALFYLTTTYALAHLTADLGVGRTPVLGLLMAGAVLKGGTVVLASRASDRFGRRPTLAAATALAALWSAVLFPLLETGRTAWIALGLLGAMALLGAMLGPVAAYLPELFPTRVRYTGAALTYNLAGVVGGATAPLVATRLTAAYGTAVPVGWYLAALGGVSVLCVLGLPETRGADLDATGRRTPVLGGGAAAGR
ncbi:MFS transporter [Streptomyces sp. NRRL B-24484]|uniref:MFS transporter n=1 Tax=Streptomyces sp. NRRL B-24484 TaxID=1463833 RepID=UPI000693F5CD|nr:MFS transporter [Streptomyces sp. NRRL B-24484]